MSKNQKLLTAVLGALIAHLLLIVAAVILLTVSDAAGSGADAAEPEPEEVTILLSDLIPEAPKEEPGRQYVRTDIDQEADRPPESARFESDRDTLAATQLLPDASTDAVEDMPTIAGREDMDALELRSRKFVEGEQIELPPPGSAASAAQAVSVAAPAMPSESQTAENSALMPSQPGAVDSKTTKPGEDDRDSDSNAELADRTGDDDETLRPDAMAESVDNVEAETRTSFADPLVPDDAPQVSRDEGEVDRMASSDRKTEEIGSLSDAESAATARPKGAKVGSTSASDTAAASDSTPMAASVPIPGAATEQPVFVPETIANEMSGTLSNMGNKAALDVAATPIGKYKKSVHSAIEVAWHRYRLSNMDDVTAGHLRLRFRVDPQGKVRNLTILRNEANIGMTEFTLKAILAAEIPAMPGDVAGAFGSGGLTINYTVLVAY